ncbi:MAG: bifunctional glutamate N-acetyltransferase/amino-acid acetyltransferase ArgJ [Candidatus Sumerlaeota bacterium]|nr:bifunctional glutamate N-acetyltransferase/amino-acid acetyltransferase ArgJ [Candidatus Sumerlaeota bacterium]
MASLPHPQGFLVGAAEAGLKKGGPDLCLIVSETPAATAGATTRNRFFSPPVAVTRARLDAGRLRAIVANSKNANAATGKRGLADAEAMAACAAAAVGADPREVAVCSTGVIGQFLPMDRIRAAIARAAAGLSPDGWPRAAQAIMTTDTRAKDAGRRVRIAKADLALRGVAKGVGMIHPNMATTLCFVGTDAAITRPQLKRIVRLAAERTFNAVTVDGDTSTSDTLIVMANGAAGGSKIPANSADETKFASALTDLLQELAIDLVRDGEGATKVIEVAVAGARSEAEAREAARKVASSNLVKTAIYGCDANWGRIAMALGNARAVFAQERVAIKILGVPVMRRGLPVAYDEPALQREMKARDYISIAVDLGAGRAKATAWGCDLTEGYIRINADYRS